MRTSTISYAAALLTNDGGMNGQTRKGEVGWPYYGGDQGGSKYSTLTGIDAGNVSRMHQAWVWRTT